MAATHLNPENPLGVRSRDDSLLEVLPVEIRILTTDLESFIPHQAMNSELRFPVELDEVAFSFRVDERERVDTEALHHPE